MAGSRPSRIIPALASVRPDDPEAKFIRLPSGNTSAPGNE